MPYAPKLREGIEIAPSAGGGGVKLKDPLFNRDLDLGGISQTLLERIDGRRTVEELLAEAAAAHPEATPDAIERSLRTLFLLNLVDGAGAAIVERTARVKRGEVKLAVETLPEARFACQGSGECCQNFVFGPLPDDDIERIAALDLVRHFPHVGAEPFYVEGKTRDGTTVKYLRTIEGRCIFLERDLRCGLHAKFGPEAKPRLCRLFPYTRLPTIESVKIYDNGECASFAVSARSGPTAAELLPELLAVLPPHFNLEHPVLLLEGGGALDYGYFLVLQRTLLDLFARGHGGALETLVAAARLARAYFAELAACPLEPGEPERTARRALSRDALSFYGPADPDALRRGCAALARLAGDLLKAIGEKLVENREPALDGNTIRLHMDLAAILRVVQAVAAHAAEPENRPLDPGFRAIAAVDAAIPDFEDLFRRSFRHIFFGGRALIDKRVGPAFLHVAMVALATVFGAKLHARLAGRDRALPEEFSHGHARALRIFRQEGSESVFARIGISPWEAVEAVPFLAAFGAERA